MNDMVELYLKASKDLVVREMASPAEWQQMNVLGQRVIIVLLQAILKKDA